MKTNALAPDRNDSARRACRWLASGLVVAMLLSTSDDARAEYEDSNQSQSQSQAGSSSGGFSFFKKPGTKTEVTSGHGSPDISQARMEAYDGPKARIAVSRFTDKTGTGWWSGSTPMPPCAA